MSRIVKCTRLADKTPIYMNLDAVVLLRRNEQKGFTMVTWFGGKESFVRVVEKPEEILGP